MATPTIPDLLVDKRFRALGVDAQLETLRRVEPRFAELSREAQIATLGLREYAPRAEQRSTQILSPVSSAAEAGRRRRPILRTGPQLEIEPPPVPPEEAAARRGVPLAVVSPVAPEQGPSRFRGGLLRSAGAPGATGRVIAPSSNTAERTQDFLRNYAAGEIPPGREREIVPNSVNLPLLLPSPAEVEEISDRNAQLTVAAIRGIARTAQALTTPENVALTAGTGGASTLTRGAVTITGRVAGELLDAFVAAGFSKELATGAVEAINAGRTAATPAQAVEAYTEGGVQGLLAVTGLTHAARSGKRAVQSLPAAVRETSRGLRDTFGPGGRFGRAREVEVVPPESRISVERVLEPEVTPQTIDVRPEPAPRTQLRPGRQQRQAPEFEPAPIRQQLREGPPVPEAEPVVKQLTEATPRGAREARIIQGDRVERVFYGEPVLGRDGLEMRPVRITEPPPQRKALPEPEKRLLGPGKRPELPFARPVEEKSVRIGQGRTARLLSDGTVRISGLVPRSIPQRNELVREAQTALNIFPPASAPRQASTPAREFRPTDPAETPKPEPPARKPLPPPTTEKISAPPPKTTRPAPVAKPAPKPLPAEPQQAVIEARGQVARAKTTRGTEVETRYAVVEAEQLITSNRDDLSIESRFPQELQPRDRTRLSSEEQISRLESQLDPELLAENIQASQGAPIVGPDAVVESGNARSIAVRRAYRKQLASGARYRDFLRENAARFGLKPEEVAKLSQPVLVRVRQTPVDRAAFALEANEASVASLSATEQARSDAGKLRADLLDSFQPSESGELLTEANREFFRGFMQSVVSPAERGRLMDAKGQISQEGLARVRNAVFAKAYGDTRAVARLAEAADNNARNISAAMLRAAPKMAKLSDAIARGERHDLGLSAQLADAAETIGSLRESGTAVVDFLRQNELFGERPALLDRLVGVMDQHKRSPKKLGDIFSAYADAVERLGHPKQLRMFSGPLPNRSEILEAAVRLVEEGHAPDTQQAQLFGRTDAEISRPAREARPGAGPRERRSTLAAFSQSRPQQKLGHPRPAESPKAEPPTPRDPESGAVDFDVVSLGLRHTIREDIAPSAREAAFTLGRAADDIRRWLMPTTRSPEAAHTGAILRESLAVMARKFDRAEAALAQARKFFDGRTREQNYEFIRKLESGEAQGDAGLGSIAKQLREILDGRRDNVRALGKGKLQSFYENYFPHIWKRRQNDELIWATFFGRNKLEGPKAFLKKRKFPTFQDGLDAGLEPVSDNAVELVLLKIREMDRYVMGHQAMREFLQQGLARFVPVENPGPVGWKKIEDPIGTVYGQAKAEVEEFFDARVVEQLNDFARSLGFEIRRVPHIQKGVAGIAYEVVGPGGKQRLGANTAFASPWDTLAHEIGHLLDYKYNLRGRFLKKPKLGETKRQRAERVEFNRQMRELADLRFEGSTPTPGFQRYVRKGTEKMATMAQAYLYAPEKFKQVAPDVWAEFETVLSEIPALGKLRSIKPSLVRGSDSTEFRLRGLLVKGHFWMPEPGAVVLNNYLMPGLRNKSGLFRVGLGANNVLNQAQLGLSAFHLSNTVLDSVSSKFGLGLHEIAHGRPLAGLRHMAETPIGPILHQVQGARLLREWYKPGSGGAEVAAIADAMTMAGGRVQMDRAFRTGFRDRFLRALKRGNVFGALARAPFAALETAAWPIMEWIVPRQKLGVFYDLARTELERLGPNAPRGQVREAMQRAWDVVDDRLGEVVYDNLFWNRFAKDVAMLNVRSVGWNWGTWRVIFGGAKDLAKAPLGFLRGKPDLSFRASYMLGFVTVTAATGAILMKLMTGEWPETMEDYFFPRTGELDDHGRPRRVSLPTYLKDAVHIAHEPGRTLANKVSPLVDLMTDMLSNRDFYGTEIRHPDDPLFSQIADVGERLAEGFTPFGFRELERAREQGRGPKGQLLPFVGLVPAPRIITSSRAEQLALEYIRENLPKGTRTKLEAERGQTRARLRTSFRQRLRGVPSGLSPADVAREGFKEGLLTPDDLLRSARDARTGPLEALYKRLTLEQALKVYEVADPDERRLIAPLLFGRIETRDGRQVFVEGKIAALANRPPAMQKSLRDQIRRVLPAGRGAHE